MYKPDGGVHVQHVFHYRRRADTVIRSRKCAFQAALVACSSETAMALCRAMGPCVVTSRSVIQWHIAPHSWPNLLSQFHSITAIGAKECSSHFDAQNRGRCRCWTTEKTPSHTSAVDNSTACPVFIVTLLSRDRNS